MRLIRSVARVRFGDVGERTDVQKFPYMLEFAVIGIGNSHGPSSFEIVSVRPVRERDCVREMLLLVRRDWSALTLRVVA